MLLIGMLIEMVGLGILLPALGLMLNSNIRNEHPSIKPYLDFLGDPSQMQLAIWGMTIIAVVYLLKALYMVFLSWRQSRFAAIVSADLSQNLFLGYLHFPYSFHLQRNSAQLIRNILNEINQFTAVTQACINLVLEFSVVLGIAIMLLLLEPIGALSVTFFFAISGILFHWITKKKLLQWGNGRQHHSGFINQHLMQGLSGVKDVKLLGREDFFFKEFAKHNSEYSRILVRVNTLGLVPRYYLELLAVIGLGVLIMVMTLQGKSLDTFIPTLGVFVGAAFRMIPSVNRIMSSMQIVRYSGPVINLLYDEFILIKNNKGKADSLEKIKFVNEIKINHLSFSYSDTTFKALAGVSLSIKKGQSIGFIGSSGSGKRTLIDVVLSLLSPDEGSVTVDQQDIQNSLKSWQNMIGYVPQSIYLTDDSLRHNIAFGIAEKEINNAAVERAIKAAQLDLFVKNLSEGLDTFVGERGIRLSGGQRQRIGIARALYHDPEILVLDEATSALDSITEKEVMQSVSAFRGEKTIIIVAHRLSTVENCDYLYRMSNGRIIEEGVPKQILNSFHEN